MVTSVKRREFITGLGATAWPLAARAQQRDKVWKIGFLSLQAPKAMAQYHKAFEDALKDLGYVEGKNIAIEHSWRMTAVDRFADLARHFVRAKVDVIVTDGNLESTFGAAQATTTIPIVFIGTPLPIERGLVASRARPGKNVTGLPFEMSYQAIVKELELLKEMVPAISRVAVPSFVTHDPAESREEALYFSIYRNEAPAAARALGLKLEIGESLERALMATDAQRPDALLIPVTRLSSLRGAFIADMIARKRLPAVYGLRDNVEEGGLISYGPDLKDIWRRGATYVDKILKGANPAELPVEPPTGFELVINLKTAKALGLTVPPTLLARANEVIE